MKLNPIASLTPSMCFWLIFSMLIFIDINQWVINLISHRFHSNNAQDMSWLTRSYQTVAIKAMLKIFSFSWISTHLHPTSHKKLDSRGDITSSRLPLEHTTSHEELGLSDIAPSPSDWSNAQDFLLNNHDIRFKTLENVVSQQRFGLKQSTLTN